MSVSYQAVQWNRQKKIYDWLLIFGIVLYMAVFVGLTLLFFPHIMIEIMLMRAFGTAAIILLHIILCIGPLARLNRNFLPILYNRRHMGVTMFILALAHSVLAMITYHVGSDLIPLVSVFVSDAGPGMSQFPFQPFGFFALVILFLMAATSHDFWLANLTAPVWKTLHMMVYMAYAFLLVHVLFGVLQAETMPLYVVLLFAGFGTVLTLHIMAARKEAPGDKPKDDDAKDEFVDVCGVDEIPDTRACITTLSGERVAVFKYDGKVSAVSNVCQHQNGPLGEGKIIDGCITCPWHGFQYTPDSGAAPAPFTEKVPTFNVKVENGRVLVNPRPNPAGTRVEPVSLGGEA